MAEWEKALQMAEERSLSPEYRGCSVHLNCAVQVVDGCPEITNFMLSDWTDDSTLRTFVNGRSM